MTTSISSIGSSATSAIAMTSDATRNSTWSQASEIDYFQTVAPSLTSPDALLSDTRALSFVTTAYGIAGDAGHTGMLARLMSEDPTLPASLAQQLSSNNYLTFAVALSHWAPPPFASQGTIDAAIAGFKQNTSASDVSLPQQADVPSSQMLSLLA